jgi:hypothetical protein
LDDMLDDERFVFVRLNERDAERRGEKSKRATILKPCTFGNCSVSQSVSQSVKNIQIQVWSRIGMSFAIITLPQPK